MRMQPPPQQKSFSFRGERAIKPAPDRQNDQLFTLCARQGHSDTPTGSSTLGITARHARQAAVLVGHVLLPALGALALGLRSIDDILLQRTAYTRFPRIDRLAVEVQRLDERDGLLDRHAVAKHARDQFRIVPELLVKQTRDAADRIRIPVTVVVLEIVTLRTVLFAHLDNESLGDLAGDVHGVLLDLTREDLVGAAVLQTDKGDPVLRTVLETHDVGRNRPRTLGHLSVVRFALLLFCPFSSSTPSRQPSR